MTAEGSSAPAGSSAWPPPADGAALRVGWENWDGALAGAALSAEQLRLAEGLDRDTGPLAALFGGSPFLSSLVCRNPCPTLDLLADGPDAAWAALIAELTAPAPEPEGEAALMRRLRLAKQRAAVIVAVADIGGLWPVERVTAALSQLASKTLDAALSHLFERLAQRGEIDPQSSADRLAACGFIVLGMGKLGADELNYSSDIDLIVLFDPDRVALKRPDRLGQTMVRLTRDLVRIMEERTADGYVFRTDLRLRPDPGATPLAVSVEAALNYYESLAQTWERAAMIKASVVAGDRAAGRAFLRQLEPFVWRRALDFAALNDIHQMKQRIDARTGQSIDIAGYNIKLGAGGIREVEFFAQAQQMIFGGREPRLRCRGTVETLSRLAELRLLQPETAESLTEAYRHLRRVEHRLQMVDDRQIYTLPKDRNALERFARFLGHRDAAELADRLQTSLGTISGAYQDLFIAEFGESDRLSFTGVDELPETEAELAAMGFVNTTAVVETVRGWLHGRYRATRTERSRRMLSDLLRPLMEALGRLPQPDAALVRLDRFLSGLPAGIQIFALLHSNPEMLTLLAEILGTSDHLGNELSRNPDHLDAVLTPGFFEALPVSGELGEDLSRQLAGQRYFEDELNLIRRFTHDHRFRASVHLLRGLTPAEALAPYLSDVADVSIATLQPLVEREFARRHGAFGGSRMAVLAFGKLGSREMSIRSDLDLIMIYDTGGDEQAPGESDGDKPLTPSLYFTRLTQRLVSAITAPTAEGALYEVDMRLRPSGNAGPLAVSLTAFERYQREDAWTWEHMALTRARPVCGPSDLRRRVEAVIREVLCRPRDADVLWRDVATMRRRIDQQHGTTDTWAVKHVRGGIVDIEFIAQALQLVHAAGEPEVLARNTAEALARLGRARHLAGANELIDALTLQHRVQAYLRLTQDGAFDPVAAAVSVRASLARAVLGPKADETAFDDAAGRLSRAQKVAHQRYLEIVEAAAVEAGWGAEDGADDGAD
ncbi:MAG: bifunctional [glutamine synthetase] adenylyltransferase/[glutamine synthetase]-adenylyl-L-tyrosine phosphorylase [Azospirillaceae bacterium]